MPTGIYDRKLAKFNPKQGFQKGHKINIGHKFNLGKIQEKSGRWKGDNVGYSGIHHWLATYYGAANHCENDKCIKTSFVYQWALVRGKAYQRKRENFIQLCRRCHVFYDGHVEKLIERSQRPVLAKKGEKSLYFVSSSEAGRILNIVRSGITNALNGRSKTAGGYSWNYIKS